jgi:citronellol/citronellal dehydrogenase
MVLKGKVVLITGASRGLGRHFALRFASRGARLVLAARTMDPGESDLPGTLPQTAAEARVLGAEVLAIRCDLSVRSQVENLCRCALAEFGRIDILVNNARYGGRGFWAPFVNVDFETWEAAFATNVMAPIVASRLCLPAMIQNKTGIILNLSAKLAIQEDDRPAGKGLPGMIYAVTKASLNRFVLALAKETRPYDIPVIAIDPRLTMTEFLAIDAPRHGIDMARANSPEVAASAIEYLCTCDDPMQYTGQMLSATELVDRFHLR